MHTRRQHHATQLRTNGTEHNWIQQFTTSLTTPRVPPLQYVYMNHKLRDAGYRINTSVYHRITFSYPTNIHRYIISPLFIFKHIRWFSNVNCKHTRLKFKFTFARMNPTGVQHIFVNQAAN